MDKTIKSVIRGSWTANLMERRCPYTGDNKQYVAVYLTKRGDRVDYPIRDYDGRIAYNDYNPPRDKQRAVEAVMPPAK